ncbi:cupin domain-containing protein [Halococcus saccharolyticus]|uniref:Cupin n=1 Tax=Halococcus saccharolyticus DSM 5350 TaxID=1227455 RepID=M0MJJ4_9EURY|nr:cupin domain-containing protein [Halococcus saccharolyticus]EMA44904.1 cupin [Halococcus saccharolyticus DSM 5350]
MKTVETDETDGFFEVVADTDRSQAATMVLSPGQSTGGPENRHPDADQWCYVADGTGIAVVGGEEHRLEPGTLVCIEAGEAHEIRNDAGAGGSDDYDDERGLRTINVYAPPVY